MQPCDDQQHGTHTTGTAAGDDGAGNQIGVAPGAKWIGCRNMDENNGRPETYTECFQFFIAPTDLNGQNPDPTKRPHVMNNSWGCPASELCAPNSLQTIVENTVASGIFVEVSAGNGGPSCSSVDDPPAIYDASYSTAALNTGALSLAGFSSRGPVTVDGSNRIKPDIAAPGNPNRSSVSTSDSAYASFSGTSMAGPHVVGVIALLWQAKPALVRDIAGDRRRFSTARPIPNVTSQNGTAVRRHRPRPEQPLRVRPRRRAGRVQRRRPTSATTTSAPPPPPPPGQWQTVSPYTIDEFGGASTSDGTYSYVFGGHSFSLGPGPEGDLNLANRYDPVDRHVDSADTDAR